MQDTLIAEAEHLRDRYTALWDVLHAESVFGFTDRYRVEGTVRRLNDLGFAVDEVSLQPVTEIRVSSKSMSPLVTGAITRSVCRS